MTQEGFDFARTYSAMAEELCELGREHATIAIPAETAISQPGLVHLGATLTLLTMGRRRPRRKRVRQELSRPPGCVLAVRYMSR